MHSVLQSLSVITFINFIMTSSHFLYPLAIVFAEFKLKFPVGSRNLYTVEPGAWERRELRERTMSAWIETKKQRLPGFPLTSGKKRI